MQSIPNWTSESPADAVKSIFSWASPMPKPMPMLPVPKAGCLALGYEGGAVKPSLVLVNDNSTAEVLGWIATYTPDAFPLTQTVRVISADVYAICTSFDGEPQRPRHDFVWSSVLLGEMLSQGQTTSSVDKVPVSRALACFSYTVARASALYGDSVKVSRILLQRLQSLEQDSIFAKRALTVEALRYIWGFANEPIGHDSELSHTVSVVLAAIETSPRSAANEIPILREIGVDIRKMSSGPIEQRVLEFERSTQTLVKECARSKELYRQAPMFFAAFAFWVGGGTRHISLLEDFSGTFPSVYAWMGLFAGLAGPEAWDSKWLRGVSAVDRHVRMPFTLADPPTADLSWVEYQFVASQKYPVEWVKELPKLSARTLTVEVLPGASCQMRLSGNTSDTVEDRVESSVSQPERAIVKYDEMEQIKYAIEILSAVVAKPSAQQTDFFQNSATKKGAVSASVSPGRKRASSKSPK